MQVVPVSVKINEDDTILSLMQQIAKTTLKAIQYSQHVIKNPPQNPVFDIMLNYHTWQGPNFHQRPLTPTHH